MTEAPERGLSEPLAVASVVDLAYAAIRERIVAGALPRGARVHQEDLAVELGVSRTPVREALRRLAAEGLVEMRTNRGARVADLDRSGMRAAYEARLVIEPGAARLAADAPAARAARAGCARRWRASAAPAVACTPASRPIATSTSRSSRRRATRSSSSSRGVLWVARIGEAIYEAQARDAGAQCALDADEHEAILAAVERG